MSETASLNEVKIQFWTQFYYIMQSKIRQKFSSIDPFC